MRKGNWVRRLWHGIAGLVMFVSLAIPFFWLVHHQSHKIQLLLILAALALDFWFVSWAMRKRAGKVLAGILTGCWLLAGALVTVFVLYSQSLGAYGDGAVTTPFFREKNVMVIVPHEDDEVNLVHGVVEQYVQNGSRVSIVFATNGDYLGLEEIRFQEALDVAAIMGVPQEDVYFLGYGDNWDPMTIGEEKVCHIYNSPDPSVVWTSHRGRQATYGTQVKDCYETVAYTRENYIGSLRRIIEDIQPDVIYANDYDSQVDHRSLSLLVDEVMCQLLAENSGYRPELFKGYCYRTAWYAIEDFVGELNIRSTREYLDPEIPEVELPYYPWQERVRVPVWAGGLNRFVTKTDGYRILTTYESQFAKDRVTRVVNGDKIFWKRPTDSLLYQAEIRVDGVETSLLNDFKLSDSRDITNHVLDHGVQTVTGPVSVVLPQAEELEALALYDDFGADNQILGGKITLDNGTEVPFGPLNDNGTATIIPIPRQSVRSFTIQVDTFRGEAPGLTEIEAYGENTVQTLEYMLFADEKDDIVYDYYVEDPEGKAVLTLYTYPHNLGLKDEDVTIRMSGSRRCSYTFRNGQLTVSCPKLASCQITAGCGDVSCRMSFSNPGTLGIRAMKMLQILDYYLAYDENPFGIQEQISYYGTILGKVREIVNR